MSSSDKKLLRAVIRRVHPDLFNTCGLYFASHLLLAVHLGCSYVMIVISRGFWDWFSGPRNSAATESTGALHLCP